MDDESSESMKLMEEEPLKKLGESGLERLVRSWRTEAGSEQVDLVTQALIGHAHSPAS